DSADLVGHPQPIERDQLPRPVVQHQPDPEHQRDVQDGDGDAFQDDVAADLAPDGVQRAPHAAVGPGAVERAPGGGRRGQTSGDGKRMWGRTARSSTTRSSSTAAETPAVAAAAHGRPANTISTITMVNSTNGMPNIAANRPGNWPQSLASKTSGPRSHRSRKAPLMLSRSGGTLTMHCEID